MANFLFWYKFCFAFYLEVAISHTQTVEGQLGKIQCQYSRERVRRGRAEEGEVHTVTSGLGWAGLAATLG